MCSECKIEQVSEDKRRTEYWGFAKESLTSMIPEALTKELELRNIDEAMWKKFFDQGIMADGTGKIADGTECPTCHGK